LSRVEEEYTEFRSRLGWKPTEQDKGEILELATTLPRIWNATTTTAKDRKRILRLLIEDVTIFAETRNPNIRMGLRWRNQYCEEIHTTKALPQGIARKHTSQNVKLIRQLAQTMTDNEIASHLIELGIRTPEGKIFTVPSIKWIRYSHKIPICSMLREGLSVKEVAERLVVSTHVVYYWIEHGILNAKKKGPGYPGYSTG
jgi:hypothetical protein